MSPLAFNIYIDDLLRTLSNSKAGMAHTVIEYDREEEMFCSSSSFVDDLVLTADSPHKLQELIDIVSRWSRDNFFHINTTKDGTGILHIGKRDSFQDFFINGNKLTTLNSKEKFSSFRYLGF